MLLCVIKHETSIDWLFSTKFIDWLCVTWGGQSHLIVNSNHYHFITVAVSFPPLSTHFSKPITMQHHNMIVLSTARLLLQFNLNIIKPFSSKIHLNQLPEEEPDKEKIPSLPAQLPNFSAKVYPSLGKKYGSRTVFRMQTSDAKLSQIQVSVARAPITQNKYTTSWVLNTTQISLSSIVVGDYYYYYFFGITELGHQ